MADAKNAPGALVELGHTAAEDVVGVFLVHARRADERARDDDVAELDVGPLPGAEGDVRRAVDEAGVLVDDIHEAALSKVSRLGRITNFPESWNKTEKAVFRLGQPAAPESDLQ